MLKLQRKKPPTNQPGVGNHRIPMTLILIFLCLLQSCSDSKRPNILILFLDDFGYNDLGINHSGNYDFDSLHTPNMDTFADTATLFSRHYTESTCSPSRAALLSGRYPARAGFTSNGRGLSPEITTLPEQLKTAHYRTHFIGKWHTGDTSPLAYPQNQGFDTWFGFLNQWMLRSEFSKAENNLERPTYENPWLEDETGAKQRYQGHLNDLISENARSFIADASKDADPWFLQVSFYAPHEPIKAAQRIADIYPDTEEGAYRAIVHQLDENIGSIIGSLTSAREADNTIIVIVSDNGGVSQRYPSNLPFHGNKAEYLEGGIRTPLMVHWLDQSLNGTRYPYAVSIMDLYPTLLSAANVDYDKESLDGRNLLPFIKENIALDRALFWEILSPDGYLFSVLSEDQKWRYSTGFLKGKWLYDLEADPHGATDVLADNKKIADDLKDSYLIWHEEIHRIETKFNQTSTAGAGILTGDSFQRSPGFGGYTFAIGVTPDTSMDTNRTSVVASQSQLLSIVYHNETLQARIQDAVLTAPLPADGKCHSIILTAQHNSRISWLLGTAPMNTPMQLIIDGEVRASLIDHREMPKSADLTAPTYIGYNPADASGDSSFTGTLSRPLIYNHAVMVNPGESQFGIDQLLQETCPDA